ncbi:hypothetical protein EIN_018300 [Entamoeba invadens IP1]|uniref:hypothetical protein n=1 Tax=Entamoeba invadens IP1 TaxID=370355 RepID=UPI0002C3EB84|nr:hypothetical protein EIN_018300 [Entamoeba invadens IP1]ELP90481.1 hypothetical protein EIN_018300 [Entamoeba invadens IP1]|eukprot:XP_004257252.1 hypothetical protein EIN_018300 [Entamoeba invadens IP1]
MGFVDLIYYCQEEYKDEDSYVARLILFLAKKFTEYTQTKSSVTSIPQAPKSPTDNFDESEQVSQKYDDDASQSKPSIFVTQTKMNASTNYPTQQKQCQDVTNNVTNTTSDIHPNPHKAVLSFSYQKLNTNFSRNAIDFLLSRKIDRFIKYRRGTIIAKSTEPDLTRQVLLKRLKEKSNVFLLLLTTIKNFYCCQLGTFPDKYEQDWHKDPSFTVYQFMENGEECYHKWKTTIGASYEFLEPNAPKYEVLFNCCGLFDLYQLKKIVWDTDEFCKCYQNVANDPFTEKQTIFDTETEELVSQFSFVSLI